MHATNRRGATNHWLLIVAVALLGVADSLAGADASFPDRLEQANERVAAHPEDARAYWRRAELRRESGDFEGALADLAAARSLDPQAPRTALLEARVHLDNGHALAAVQALEPWIRAPDSSATAHRLYGEALLRLDLPTRAAAAFSRAIDADSNPTPELYLARARAEFAAGTGHAERALVGLDEGVRRLGPIAGLVREAIEIEVAMQHYEHALARLSAASARARRKEAWLEWRGRILEQAGRPLEARDSYLRARRELARAPAAQRSSRAMRALDQQLQEALAMRLDAASDREP